MFVSVIVTIFFFITANVAEESDAPCPATWTLNEMSKTCVKPYNDRRVTWKKARYICQSEGGHLVVIQNSQMNDFVQGLLSLKRYWIGSRYNSTTKMMRYLDGEEMTLIFEAWAPRQPNNYRGKQECIEIIRKREGLWNDRPCKRRNHFVCEKPAVEKNQKDVTPTVRTTVGKCDPGWVHYEGDDSCLLYKNDTRRSYNAANRDCMDSYGGSLVIIHDEKKDSFIKDHIIVNELDTIWTGLKRKYHEGGFPLLYADGEKLGDYHPWANENPIPGNHGYDCVMVMYDQVPDSMPIWYTDPCSHTYFYICEL